MRNIANTAQEFPGRIPSKIRFWEFMIDDSKLHYI